TVAVMTEALKVGNGDKVLEIGTGSGYQAAILAAMGVRVFTIERIPSLLKSARSILENLGVRFLSKLSDGSMGWKELSPFDGILVTAGAPDIPKPLVEQLKVGKRLVVPVGSQDFQQMKVVTKISDNNDFKVTELADFKFVPLIGKEGWPSGRSLGEGMSSNGREG
ncbi:MAG: hypothetical protein M1339_04600, partial [Bacteroidetes bacterium]|nr:hypothetical protein [Bacteroidota bacterium]